MKYILAIDSLTNTFSYVECSEDILFKYEDKNGIVLSDVLKAGDLLLIYKKRPSASIKMLMEVKEINEAKDLILFKHFECKNGLLVVDREKIKEFEKNTLTEVTEDYFNCIIEQLLKTTSNHIPMTDTDCPEDIYEVEEPIVEYNKKQFLQDVFMKEDEYETLKQILTYKRNIILQGSPGVGKTYLAKRFAYSLMNETDSSRVKLIQFHQNYSYEDFIMGYKPDAEGFKLIDGVFFEFCQKAERDGREHYFIIDEINRGNVSKIFGELMMLIENDKRGVEKLRLAYKDVLFTVPKNVYIIGMMNTADRSLAIMDYALRRRFSFYEVEPAFGKDNFINHLRANGITEPMIKKINENFVALNNYIADEKNSGLGSGFRIGHSYFCTKPNCDEDKWYENIIKFEIQPMLEEYWFDEKDKVAEWMGKIK